MNGLLEFAVSNALVAALAAVIVAGVTRVWRNPHLAHLLWALVLVKLVTPPLVDVPIPVFSASPLPQALSPAVEAQAATTSGERIAAADTTHAGSAIAGSDPQPTTAGIAPKPTELGGDLATSLAAASRTRFDWTAALVFVWATGSAIWLGVLATGVLRFHRLVRGMPAAPEAWQQEIAALAARVDLRVWPGVRLAAGAISPLLWPIGARPVILLPRALVQRLDADGHRALLAHELAHYYRRDHWVRWFEMLVLAVHWWNPVAWWARRQLRVAEERCCDAWAIWLLDGEAHCYGRTLLETIDFLADARTVSPMAASGMGTSGNLKGRFEMILESRFGRRLSWRTRLAVAATAVLVLPCSLSLVRVVAQTNAEKEPPAAAERPSAGWARLSPFTAVHVKNDAADVEFEGKQYELVSIDGLTTKELLDGARKKYGTRWEKRFVEDLVEVMDGMGHRPAATVKLVLRDPASSEAKTVERAPMTAENRAKVYAKAHNILSQLLSGGRTWARLSPFTAVRVSGDDAEVEFDGQRYQLVSIDDLPTKEILDGARKHYADHWKKRFVEDLVEVMDAIGHRPGATVKLVLRDPRSSAIKTVERAPMTAENREKVHIAHHVINAEDAKRIRQLIAVFAAAVEKSDLDALEKTLRPRAAGEGRDLAYFSRATKELPAGSHISLVRTIVPLHNHHAMAVTDFFGAEVPGQAKSQCVVYHCVRQDGRWTIDSIEVVDDAGLGRALRDAPHRALAEAVD
jgi:beta-lactamase regulating signal transducer with metallopeptidase domain